ncbi:alpha/beta fold hydrolase [Nocardia cyriacigeorgica]|uniref:alpha/beta fold hydrolase n=1 Tax=Nocardia cyriacigeorgica TaxID=135487 RepID=UPI0024551380|nr:alpha/beta fold hydrolase [Nocardia cyriacigeorgica]
MTAFSHASSARPTFVLVHGSGTSSFMWTSVQRELALRSHRTYAVDLPGHGLDAQYLPAYQAPQDLAALATTPSTLAEVGLADNVATVLDAVVRLHEHGPVVLVGASLGGTTITVAANRAPHLIDRLVYISAWVCTTRPSPVAYMSEPEFADSVLPELAGLNVGDPALGAGRANYRTADPELLRGLKEATMADRTDAEFMAFLDILQPDESLAAMTDDATADPETWGTVARTFVRLTGDRSIPLAMQDRLIAEADASTPGNRFDVHSLDTTHAGFIYRAAEIADLLTASV